MLLLCSLARIVASKQKRPKTKHTLDVAHRHAQRDEKRRVVAVKALTVAEGANDVIPEGVG
jgi:hypothetical protein